jgi:hypothetical protein
MGLILYIFAIFFTAFGLGAIGAYIFCNYSTRTKLIVATTLWVVHGTLWFLQYRPHDSEIRSLILAIVWIGSATVIQFMQIPLSKAREKS